MEKISGIYKIQSKLKSERFYIGSAISIYKRWGEHLSSLRNNRHCSKKLQRHFNKYGEVDLEYSILLGCDIIDLIKTEQYFLDSYLPYFNTCKIAGSTLGVSPSKETRKKQSDAKKGKSLFWFKGIKHSRERIENQRSKIYKRSVYQCDKQGDIIKEWDSTRIAAVNLGLDRSGIRKVANGERKTLGGFIWKFKVA